MHVIRLIALTLLASSFLFHATAAGAATAFANGGPDLEISKSDGGITAVPGGTIVYSLDATYVAGSADGQDLIFTETVPSYTTFAAGPSDFWLCAGTGAGSTCTRNAGPGPLAAPVTFAVVVDSALPPDLTEIVNTATLNTGTDPDLSNNMTTIATPFALGGPDLEVSKSDGGITAVPGGTIVYSLDATYVAGSADGQQLIFSETVPPYTTFAAGPSDFWLCAGTGAGSTCTHNAGPGPLAAPVTFAVIVDGLIPPKVTEIMNTATLNTGTDPDLSNNMTTIATPFALGGPDLEVSKSDGGITAVPGGTIVYSLDAAYVSGSADGQDLIFTETVPSYTTFAAGPSDFWLCAGTGAGSICTHNAGPGPLAAPVSFAVIVDGLIPPKVTEIINTAILSTGTDPDPSNNTATIATPFDGPDLEISKSDGGITAVPGGTIVYTLDATYVTGTADGEDLIFTETVPLHTTFAPGPSDPWLCAASCAASFCTHNAGPGPLAAPVIFAVVVDPVLPPDVTEIINTASLSTGTDPDLSNNTVTITTSLDGPDLEISKSDGGITAIPGGTIVYTLDASYVTGTADSEDLVFTETVPAHTTFVAGPSDFWLCTGTGAGSTCTHNSGPGPLASPVSFAVVVDTEPPPDLTEILNTASLSTGTDPVLSNNTVTISTTTLVPVELQSFSID